MTPPQKSEEKILDKGIIAGFKKPCACCGGAIKTHWQGTEVDKELEEIQKEEREKTIEEVIKMVKENQKGTFTDDGGNDGWYISDLVKQLNKIKNNK